MANKQLKFISLFLVFVFILFSAASVGASASPLTPAKAGQPVSANSYSDLKLYVGGIPFGVKFITQGVLVVGFHEVNTASGPVNPAQKAGLQCNDILLKVNGTALTDAATLTAQIEASDGKAMTLVYSRKGQEQTATLIPVYSSAEGRYSGGIYVRDSGAGIGTVTFIHPKTQAFAGLGHGICDGDTGELIPMQRGSVVDVTISGVVRGLSGSPGEVKGYFSSGKTGSLLNNTHCGVYGVLATLPSSLSSETPLSVGTRNELKEGKATIFCTLDSNIREEYEIEISAIQRDSQSNKCFTVKVTDSRLLEKTGGIIQGMSGSPIVQNGKLVGAVTHVLINDPTTGYGIFIENMLNQMGSLLS